MSDLPTGPFKGTELPKPSYIKPQRETELYKGEPPITGTDNKIPMVFTIQQKCNLDDTDPKTKKKFKCGQKLQVVRVKNQVFQRDESGYGGQLIYDESDIHQYVVCPVHNGLPERYDRWEQK